METSATINNFTKNNTFLIKQYLDSILELECPICLENFDDCDRSPLMLCSKQHNCCQKCTKLLLKTKKLQCPICKGKVVKTRVCRNRLLYRMMQDISKAEEKEKKVNETAIKEVQDIPLSQKKINKKTKGQIQQQVVDNLQEQSILTPNQDPNEKFSQNQPIFSLGIQKPQVTNTIKKKSIYQKNSKILLDSDSEGIPNSEQSQQNLQSMLQSEMDEEESQSSIQRNFHNKKGSKISKKRMWEKNQSQVEDNPFDESENQSYEQNRRKIRHQ